MKKFKVVIVRAAYMTKTVICEAVDKSMALDMAWRVVPSSYPAGFADHPELASYEIESITEFKESKSRKKKP